MGRSLEDAENEEDHMGNKFDHSSFLFSTAASEDLRHVDKSTSP